MTNAASEAMKVKFNMCSLKKKLSAQELLMEVTNARSWFRISAPRCLFLMKPLQRAELMSTAT